MLGEYSDLNTRRSQWRAVSRILPLAEDEVQVWLVTVDEELRSLLEPALSLDEQERARAFRFRRHQNEFIVARGALRSLLSHYVSLPVPKIEIVYSQLGKPHLQEAIIPAVTFNVSHSGGVVVLAFSLGRDLGIDIEHKVPDAIDDGLVRQCLADPETLRFKLTLPDERTDFFFDLWARKEAYMKLLGDGLNIPPVSLNLPPHRYGHQVIQDNNVYFSEMPELEGFALALATRDRPDQVEFYTFSAKLLT